MAEARRGYESKELMLLRVWVGRQVIVWTEWTVG
jgi:hypothetical protein